MVKTEVSARVSSWLFFLNRRGLIGKRGNIPSGERVAGWHNSLHSHALPICLLTVIASAAKQSRSLSAAAFLDCFAALAMTEETVEILQVFCPTGQAEFRFIERTRFAKTTPCTVERPLISNGKSLGARKAAWRPCAKLHACQTHPVRVLMNRYTKAANMGILGILFTYEGHERAIDVLYNFDGRISRSDYWLSWLLWMIAGVALFFASVLLQWLPYLVICLWLIFMLLAFNSIIAAGRKRLHDRGKTGWWLLLLYLSPIACLITGLVLELINIFGPAWLALFVWAIAELGVVPGTVGPNKYGPDPLDPGNQPG